MHATNLVVVGTDDPAFATMTDTPVSARTALQLGFAYAFAGRFEAGLRLPFYSQSGSDPQFSGLTPAQGTAFGDVVLHGKAALMSTASMGVAASLDVSAPTATDGQFAGVDGPSGHVHGIAGWHGNRLAFNGNLGLLLRGAGELGNISQGNAVTWGVGASYRALPAAWVIAESVGQVGMGSASPSGVRNLEGLLGVRYEVGSAIGVSVGVGRGVLNGVGSPDLRGFVLIDVSPRARKAEPLVTRPPPPPRDTRDDDGDGVVNADDACPMDAEDVDDFQDDDGCPDLDNDGDGIADIDDACPDEPGDADHGGCPVAKAGGDRDGDGIPDAYDKCPDQPEDRDGYQDEDGCPDPDNDGDGIADVRDLCPNEPEDFDGFQDEDGCPDPDNDGDRIPDKVDKCPNEPETYNGYQDDDGCPDKGRVIVTSDSVKILDKIHFDTDSARIQERSDPILDAVAATLIGNPGLLKIEVQGHADERGSDRHNLDLTRRRAEAVVEALVRRGVARDRLRSAGYGERCPVDPSHTAAAWEKNRRVEFKILETEDGPTGVEVTCKAARGLVPKDDRP